MSLSPQQERFAEEFASGVSGAEAARRSGYAQASAKQRASELVKRPDVSQRIAELQREKALELGVTHRQLVTEALRYHELAMAGDAPMSAGIRALDLAARLLGAFAPTKHQVESRKVSVTMNLTPREEVFVG